MGGNMIDVIIPAFNSHEYIENVLYSLLMQTVKDKINIYIVDDCSKKNYDEIIDKFKKFIIIKQLRTNVNSGPAVARQLGIDSSNSKYIMFIDADDIFDNCYSIEKLYNCIEESKANVVSSFFTEETSDSLYNHDNNDVTWLHGKIYRRSFIEKHNIRFNESRANEDTGFNRLLYLLTDFYFIPDYTYIWKCNMKSLTRSTDYGFYGLEGFAYNICWAIEEGIKRNACKKKIAIMVYENILEMYYRYIYFDERKEKKLLLEWTKPLKKYYDSFSHLLDENDKYFIIKDISGKFIDQISPDIYINYPLTFEMFLNLL